MSDKPAPALDIVVRREDGYVVVEFIDAKCHCYHCQKECYSTGYIRLTPDETIKLALHMLQVAVSKNLNK